MKEAYVTFENAKLLKEKGFDWECAMYYNAQHDEARIVSDTFICNWNDESLMERLMMSGAYSIPTQQMACRWLREEKGVFVDIRVYSGLPVQFGYDISVLYPDKTLVDKGGTFGFSSYEEATEKGLKYVLQNLSKYL